MNLTTKCIIDRLPNKPLLSPAEISAACGMTTPNAVIAAIQEGTLEATRLGGRFIVSREAAIKWIESAEVKNV